MSSMHNGDSLNLVQAFLDLEIKMKHEFRQQAEKQLKKLEKYGEMMEKRMENIESKFEILLNENNNNEGHFKNSGGRHNFDEGGAIWSPNNDFGGNHHQQQQRGFVPRMLRNGRPNNNNQIGYYGKQRHQNWNGPVEKEWLKGIRNPSMAKNSPRNNDGLFYRAEDMAMPPNNRHQNGRKIIYNSRSIGQNGTNLPANENGHRNNSPIKLEEKEKTMLKSVTGKWVSKVGEYYTTDEEEEDEEKSEDEKDEDGKEDSSDYRNGKEEEMNDKYDVAKPAPGYFDADGNRIMNLNGENVEDSDECENGDEEKENIEEEVLKPMSIVHICPAKNVHSAPLLYQNSEIEKKANTVEGTSNSGDDILLLPTATSGDGGFGKGRRK